MKLLVATVAFGLVTTFSHAQTFLLCTNTTIVSSSKGSLFAATNEVNKYSSANSTTGCSSHCTSLNVAYSYFTPGECYCSNTYPSASYTDKGKDSLGHCNSTSYLTDALETSASFIECYTNASSVRGGGDSFVVDDPGKCFSDCSAYSYLSITPFVQGFGSHYVCRCGQSFTGGLNATCDSYNLQLYKKSGSAKPSTSALMRRQQLRRMQEEEEARTITKYCPRNLVACLVPGASIESNSYECVDPVNELESCGGCTAGYFGSESSAPAGQDCTQLPGVAMGGVSCRTGKCIVTSCKYRWELHHNRCVRSVPQKQPNPPMVLQ